MTASDNNIPELDAPARLVADLRALQPTAPEVPSEVDERILEAARQQLEGTGRRRWGHLVYAAAAAVLLGVTLWLATLSMRDGGLEMADEAASSPPIREDLDGSGRVDILDAFQLARAIRSAEKSGGPAGADLDLTGDGRVDGRDVDHLARLAVIVR